MKKIGVLILVVALVWISCSCAEEAEMTMYDAFDEMNKVAEKTLMLYSGTDDEEEKVILEKCLMSIASAQAGIMLVDAYTSSGTEQRSYVLDDEITNRCYDSGTDYIEEIEKYKNYQLVSQNGIICFIDNTYNGNTELIGKTIIKMGVREDSNEVMLFLSIFEEDGYLSSTGRFLVHDNNGVSRCLYTRTLGEVFETKLDLEKWISGEEIEWTKELLFP